MFDQVMSLIDVALLGWIVYQGEFIRYYEREVWRMNAERFEERKVWRREKQEQTRKKTALKTNESSASLVSVSQTEMRALANKTVSAKSVAVLLTPTDPPI